MKKTILAFALLALLAFAIPIEHKYDKLFRFFSLTLIPSGLDISAQYEKKLYFYLSDLAVLLLVCLCWKRIQWRLFFGHPLWIIFLCAVASIMASPFFSYPIAYSRLLQLLTPFLLFSLLAAAFTEEERPRLTRVLFLAIFSAALFQSAVGIAQYFHEGSLGLRLLGEPNTFSTFRMHDHSRWIFDRLFSITPPSEHKIRAVGTMPHTNVLGGWLVLSLLITYALIAQAKKHRWLWSLAIPLQVFALFLTYSRASLFAWVLATGVWFMWVKKPSRWVAGSVCSSILLSLVLLYPQISERGGVFNYNELSQSSDKVRLFHQSTALTIIKDNPLFGLGFGQFTERAQKYFSPDLDGYTRSTAPHNIYLFLACETGLISLFAFLAFIALRLALTRSLPRSAEAASLIGTFIAFLFIGFCDFYPILFQQGRLMFFLTAGLLAAYGRVETVNLSREEIWKMFDLISPTYDRINRILSFGMDQKWRKRVAAFLPASPSLQVLDLATGTGDQIAALLPKKGSFTGIDLSQEMLDIARKKLGDQACLLRADAENLPFAKESFDAATFSFGIRNVTHPLKSLQEIHRVLKQNGRCLILEFSLPAQPIRPFYLLYLRHILPHLGGLLSRKRTAYRYLHRTIEQFPSGQDFCLWMKQAGFTHLQAIPMALGAVTLYVGDKT